MDLTELVSPHVAMPVLGVVVCAIMVFAFGFRSPVQPPSFNFEEDGDKKNKRKIKHAKGKTPINGHIVNEPLADEVLKPVNKSPKEAKVKTETQKVAAKREVKANKKEKNQQLRKQEKEVEVAKEKISAKKETEDDGEWTTIQLSKKSKKQKTTKKDKTRADSENEAEPVSTPAIETVKVSAQTPDITETNSAVSLRTKLKKQEKNLVKSQPEEKEVAPPVVQSPVAVSSIDSSQSETQQDSKKKKSKKDKKVLSPDNTAVDATAVEDLPKEAAPATSKPAKSESTLNKALKDSSAEKSKSSSTGKKPKSVPLSAADQESAKTISQPQIPAQDLPKTSKKGKVSSAQVQAVSDQSKSSHAQSVTEPSKLSPKKKAKKPELPQEAESVKVSDIQVKPAESSKKADNTRDEKKKPEAKTSASVADTDTAMPSVVPATSNVTFDEVGDSWQEAAPKSKKKKPRRDN